jgi:hypothetical protein
MADFLADGTSRACLGRAFAVRKATVRPFEGTENIFILVTAVLSAPLMAYNYLILQVKMSLHAVSCL